MNMQRACSRGRALGLWLAVAAAFLTGCDRLLEVDLPDAVTDQALDSPGDADVQVNGVVALIECGYGSFVVEAEGFAGSLQRVAGASPNYSEFDEQPDLGTCDSSDSDLDWYEPMQIGRVLGVGTYNRLNGWSDAEVGENRVEMMATVALYVAVTLDVFGEHFCEMALDAGELMTVDQTLGEAETWIQTALGHIATAGDFALLNGAATSAQATAYALRTRVRWARGDFAGAQADAANVPQGFTAWVTREAGQQRRSKAYQHLTASSYGYLFGPVNNAEWNGAGVDTNPVTGVVWPDPIPFTGMLDLGILADGRAVDAMGYAVLASTAGAVYDTRVPNIVKSIQGPLPGPVPARYSGEGDDIPLVSWRETWLILAEIEGGQGAIDRVNAIRTSRGLPLVTYADPNNATEIEYMIFEERRREFHLEGRFWSTKILNTDKLVGWFPRRTGTRATGYAFEGGVRMLMPTTEYDTNANFDRTARGTGCDASQRPVFVG